MKPMELMLKTGGMLAMVLLGGCGAVQDWTGTYKGTVSRAEAEADVATGMSASETLVVTDAGDNDSGFRLALVRTRQGEAACKLQGHHGSDHGGGDGMTIKPGARCTVAGSQRVLIEGELYDRGIDYTLELKWGESETGDVTLFELGHLKR